MGEIASEIKAHSPNRVVAYCGECEGTLFDTMREDFVGGPHQFESLVAELAVKHRERTGHDDLQIDLNKTEIEEIEFTINVSK